MPTGHEADLPKFPFARPANAYEPPKELAQLRQQGPVARIQLFDGTLAWIVTRHKEVCEILGNVKLSNERFNREGYPEIHSGNTNTGEKPTFVHMDDPEHKRQRDMIEEFFIPEAAEALRPQVNQVIDSLLQHVKEVGCKGGPVDLVEEFASLVNPRVIFLLFGVHDDIDKLAKSSAEVRGTSGTAGESSGTDLHEYMCRLVDERIKYAQQPRDDLISKLVVEQFRSGGDLSRDDINRVAFMIFIAGNAAITSSISLGILTLLQHPDQLGAIRDNPELLKQAINEILRYHTPSALNSRRVAKEDIVIGNQDIKAGEGIICSVRSANRDPRVFTDPDRFDIHRNSSADQNLAFGYGTHRCQAEWLSRLMLEVALGALIQKLPHLRLAVPPTELEYTPLTQNVGLIHLPVYF